MYYPTLEEVKKMGERGNLVPIWCEVSADMETPVSAFLKIASGGYSFLLESVEGGERIARYSFLGTEPYKVLRTKTAKEALSDEDPLKLVKNELDRYRWVGLPGLPRFCGGAVGYLSYETVRHLEALPLPPNDPLGVPEAVFLFVDTFLVFDHVTHKIRAVSHVHLDGNIEASYAEAVKRLEQLVSRLNQSVNPKSHESNPLQVNKTVRSNFTREQYEAMVERIRKHIIAGDCIQVVPSQRISRPVSVHPFDIYRALRTINPSPYMYYLHLNDFYIVGASPELLVRVEDGMVDYRPLAGTRRRGRDEAEDRALESELKNSVKEQAEHIMLVDLGRNDVGRVSVPGTVRVPEQMYVVRYSHVMHLESHVQGKLRPELSPIEALRVCLPAGTLAGAPKVRAMQIIAGVEPDVRGPYGGAVGYISFSGNLDTAIAIRTIVVKDGIAHVQAGGGIVYDSVPGEEYQESLNKARAPLKAIEEAEANSVTGDKR
ncbi:MAG: anthranilate synthase component I [Chloroflexota bacterium]